MLYIYFLFKVYILNKIYIMGILAQIERKLKFNEKILEQCLEGQEDNIPGGKNEIWNIY